MSKGLANIMKQAQMMQQRMAKIQEEASLKTAEASAGGGVVTALVNGKNQIVSLTIKKEAVDPEDVEMLQDLVVAAVNEALTKVQAEIGQELVKRLAAVDRARRVVGIGHHHQLCPWDDGVDKALHVGGPFEIVRHLDAPRPHQAGVWSDYAFTIPASAELR